MGKPSKAATTPRPGSAKAALKLKPPKHLLNDAAAAELADIYARKEQIESQLQEVERQVRCAVAGGVQAGVVAGRVGSLLYLHSIQLQRSTPCVSFSDHAGLKLQPVERTACHPLP